MNMNEMSQNSPENLPQDPEKRKTLGKLAGAAAAFVTGAFSSNSSEAQQVLESAADPHVGKITLDANVNAVPREEQLKVARWIRESLAKNKTFLEEAKAVISGTDKSKKASLVFTTTQIPGYISGRIETIDVHISPASTQGAAHIEVVVNSITQLGSPSPRGSATISFDYKE